MRAMIWAAGLGTRLRPLTEDQPKAMVPVLGKPMLEHAIWQCRQAGIREIMINLHYFPETIQNYFGDGSKWDMQLYYSYEEVLLENAGALVKVRDFFQDEPFFALGSDNLADVDLEAMRRQHQEQDALVTIATSTADDVSKYGIIGTNDAARITSFQEKPKPEDAKGDQIATLFYLFSPKIFDFLPEKPDKIHFGKEVFPPLLDQAEPLYAHHHEGYWNDVGNPNNYLAANFDMLDGKIHSTLTEPDPKTGIHIDKNTFVSSKAKIVGPVWIGAHGHIGDGAEIGPYTVIGDHARVESGAKIQHSVLWNHCIVESESSLKHSILANHSKIYSGLTLSHLVLGQNSEINQILR